MILAISFPTWLQVGSTVAAAAAAVASWIAVVQARRIAQEAREAEAEAMLPLLLVSLNFNLPGVGQPTMGVALYNAGGSVAKNVAVLLVAESAYARQIIGFLRPGETATFGSELPATDAAHAIAYARSQDGRDLVWDHEGERRELKRPPSGWPVWEATFEVFYPRRGSERSSPHEPPPGRRPALLTRIRTPWSGPGRQILQLRQAK